MMRNIEVKKWKAQDNKGVEVEENTIQALGLILSLKKPEQMPKGIDNFRIFSRFSKAFEEAEKSKIIKLEEHDYNFMKKLIDSDVPSIWGLNKNIVKMIEDFMNTKEGE